MCETVTVALCRRYILLLQLPIIPELLVSCCDFKVFELIAGKLPHAAQPGSFTPADIEAYKWAMSQGGSATCTINYYREVIAAVGSLSSIRLCRLCSATLLTLCGVCACVCCVCVCI